MKKHLLLIPLLFCLSETISTNSSATSESFLSDKKIEEIDSKINSYFKQQMEALESMHYPLTRAFGTFISIVLIQDFVSKSIENEKIQKTISPLFLIITFIATFKVYYDSKKHNNRCAKEANLAEKEINMLQTLKSTYYLTQSHKI